MTVSAPLPVVVIPVPAVNVTVSPEVIIELLPDVAASVNSDVDVVKQVAQATFPAAERVIGELAETATVPLASGIVTTLLDVVGVQERVPVAAPSESKTIWLLELVKLARVKVATPAVVIDQLSSVIDTPVAETFPMLMVEAIAALPILMVSAVVPPLPMFMVSANVPVPKLIVFAMLLVNRLPVVDVAPATGRSSVTDSVSSVDMLRYSLAPSDIDKDIARALSISISVALSKLIFPPSR